MRQVVGFLQQVEVGQCFWSSSFWRFQSPRVPAKASPALRTANTAANRW